MERNTAEAKLADALDPRVLEARDLHQAGRLAEAEPLYRRRSGRTGPTTLRPCACWPMSS